MRKYKLWYINAIKEIFITIGMIINLTRINIEMNCIYIIEWFKRR
jgi:hypothetical protein